MYRSRLGCQIEMCEDLDGITVRIPSATRNLRVDGMYIYEQGIIGCASTYVRSSLLRIQANSPLGTKKKSKCKM